MTFEDWFKTLPVFEQEDAESHCCKEWMSAAWTARQRHDAEIAREWFGTEANADTIADAIERSE